MTIEKPEFNPQISLLRYLQISKYYFPEGYNNNPLINKNKQNKSNIYIPNPLITNEDEDLCTKLINESPNRFDQKAVNCLKFFNNSKFLMYGTSMGNIIICDIYDNFSLFKKHQLKTPCSIRAMEFNKHENKLLIGDGNGNISIFNIDSNFFDKTKKIEGNQKKYHTYIITDINFSISNTKFITSSDDKLTKIIDFETSEEIFSLKNGSDVKSCDWNPYMNMVTSGGKDQRIQIWDPSTGKIISTLHPHKDTINRLRFNKNGNWLLSASKDQTIKLFDIRTMKEMQTFKSHEKGVNTISWHPIHESLFCSSGMDKNIIYWKVGQPKNLFVIKNSHDEDVFDLCFNNTGTLLASGSSDKKLKFWIREF